MNEIDLIITPRKSGLLAGQDNTVEALVRAVAPEPDAEAVAARQALNLSIVIDRSGSMSGAPLHEAKRCASFIVDQLKPCDRLSIIAYDSTVDVVVPSRAVIDRETFHGAIHGIHERGTTALHAGWLKGAEQTALGQSADNLSRVLLLSDGNANVGLTDTASIANQCMRLAAEGVTTSTYGLGHHFNEDLMLAMAQAGQGNGYYGETAADLMDPFRQEFELLRFLCARSMRMRIASPCGGRPKLLNDYSMDGDGRYLLPDLALGGEAWALVRIDLPADLLPRAGGEVEVLKTRLTFKSPGSPELLRLKARLRLPLLEAGAFANVEEDETVLRRVQEIRAAELQTTARTAARRGDWELVDEILMQARREAGNNAWVLASLNELEAFAHLRQREQFSKEAAYKSRRMHSRMVDVFESDSYSLSEEALKPTYLRRKVQEGKELRGDD